MSRKPPKETYTPEQLHLMKLVYGFDPTDPDNFYYVGKTKFIKPHLIKGKTRLQVATEEGYPDDEFLRDNPDVAKEILTQEGERNYRELLKKQHKKPKAIDWIEGTIDPKLYFKRIFQYLAVFIGCGLLIEWADDFEKSHQEAKQPYWTFDPSKPRNQVKSYPPGGGMVIYHDFSKPYDLTKDRYYYGTPNSRGKSRYASGKSIQRWGNTTTIESGDIKIELEMSPEDILEHIDEEDILDYMDGAVD